MQKVLILLSFITSSLFSMELALVQESNKMRIDSSSTFISNQLGDLELYRGKKGFYVHKDDQKHHIKKYFTDPIIRDMTKKQLTSFLKQGYLSVNKMDDGEYSLKAKQRLNGGGPVTGWMAYWITKSVCYGTAAAAVGTLAVGGAGAIGAATGAASAITAGGIVGSVSTGGATAISAITGISTATTTVGGVATAVTTITTGTLGATGTVGSILAGLGGPAVVATGGIAGAITNVGLAGEAATLTAGVISSVGSVSAAIAGVESASLGIGAFFTAIPFLP